MAEPKPSFTRLAEKRKEQTPQAMARLVVVGLFVGLWFVLLGAGIPMPVPFLLVLLAEITFFLVYLRVVALLPNVRAVSAAQYVMLATEIVFHTTIVYFLGGVSWLGAFAYVFGLIFTNAFVDLRRGLVYTTGASLAFCALIILEATGVVPHYQYLSQAPSRYQDPQLVTTTVIGAIGVFYSIYLWVNWVGHQLRQERDAAIRAQDEYLRARTDLQTANEELEQRVIARTAELEGANAELRQSDERLRTVITSAPVVLLSLNRDGVFTLFEGKGLEALGIDQESVLGHSVYDVFRNQVHVTDAIRRCLEGNDVTIPVRTGRVIYDTQLVPMRDTDDDIIGVIGVANDVTGRHQAEEAARVSEERFIRLAKNVPDIIFRFRMAEPQGYEYVSPAVESVLGYRPEDFYEDPELGESTVHPGDREGFDVSLGPGDASSFVGRWTRKDGAEVWLDLRYSRVTNASGELVAIEGIARDVTESKKWDDALRQSEAKFRAMAETVAAAAFIFQGAKMRYINRAAEEITGYTHDELFGMNFWDVIHPDFKQLVMERGMARQRGEAVPNAYEVKLLTKSGEERWVQFTAGTIDYEGEPAVLGTAFDITQRKEAEAALHEAASRDPLTGLLNRRAGLASIEEQLAKAGEGNGRLAVLALDLDRFKRINDTFSHEVGDEALCIFSRVLQDLIGEQGVLCRLGGDEFAIVLPDAGVKDGLEVARAIQLELRRALTEKAEASMSLFTVSIGVSVFPDDGRTVALLNRHADDAMYAAKAAGGDRYAAWSDLPPSRAA